MTNDNGTAHKRTGLQRLIITGLETWSGLSSFLGIVLWVFGLFLLIPQSAEQDLSILIPVGGVMAIGGWTLFLIARVHRAGTLQSYEKALDRKRLALREGFLVTLATLLGCTAFAVLAKDGRLPTEWGIDLENDLQTTGFFLYLLMAFLPLLVCVFHVEKHYGSPRKKIIREDAISPGSFWFSVALLGFITALAILAGRKFFDGFGPDLGIAATFGIVALFGFFIVLSSFTRAFNLFTERKLGEGMHTSGPPQQFSFPYLASCFDSFLVRVLAPLIGATNTRDGNHGFGPHHLFIIGVMGSLTALGYALPQPTGLFPIVLAFLFALAIGRRWAWVENDRETAAMLRTTESEDIHIGFSNDLRDEAMLAYSFLFLLVPMSLYQINDMTGAFHLRDGASGTAGFFDWIQYFGLELFKSVPLVDWAEIYGLQTEPRLVKTENVITGSHLIFAARVLVDFVVMAALFQAISIFQRNRTQRNLYNSGHLDILDPITEEEFFQKGMMEVNRQDWEDWNELETSKRLANPVIELKASHFSRPMYLTAKRQFCERVETHVASDLRPGLSWPYSKERLDALVSDQRPDLQAGAKWMIQKFELLAGDPKYRIGQLADRWEQLAARGESLTIVKGDRLLVEKQNFETVIDDASKQAASITDKELSRLMGMVVDIKGRPEFHYGTIRAFELIGKINRTTAARFLAASVLKPNVIQEDTILQSELDGLTRTNPRQTTDDMRVYAYEAIGQLLSLPTLGQTSRAILLATLQIAKDNDAAKSKSVVKRILRELS